MQKAVLFDLDGVIVDTALYHYQGWKKLADELGIPFDEKANEKLRGVPRRESLLALMGRNPGEDKIKEYTDRKNQYYLKMVHTLKPQDTLPGAKVMLAALRDAGVKVALGSSSKNARLVLKLLKLTKAFDAIVDGTEIKKGKPDPELFIKCAQRLGIEPRNCLVVEDAESGIEAAVEAGMHTLGIGDPQNLRRAQRVVSGLDQIDMDGLVGLIDGIPVPGNPDLHTPAPAKLDDTWRVIEKGFKQKRQAWRESLFALANGYLGVRGSVEEYDLPYPDSRPDTFVAGVFDKYESWYQAIVNLPFPFATRFTLAGSSMSMTKGKVKRYRRELDMYRGILTRSFVWQDAKGRETEFTFRRLVSLADRHLAALQVDFKPLNWSGGVTLDNFLDADVDNIDFHKGGYQLRPERYYFVEPEAAGALGRDSLYLTVKTKTNPHRVAEAVRLNLRGEHGKVRAQSVLKKEDRRVSRRLRFQVKRGRGYQLEKMIGITASRDGYQGARLLKAADAAAQRGLRLGFRAVAEEHAAVWCRRWRAGDVAVTGHPSDQQALRFSIFHLTQFPNPADNRVNIGSRGLTAEMHYGNCFWDTELFILPFYLYTWPESARALLEYRYQTLPEARNKAKRLFFRGAMFPWMSSYPGQEQADYWEYANIAVHVVGDIHYALQHYLKITADGDFLEKYGAEIVLETARFWHSRAYYNPRRRAYVINTVKGPNEYDGVINNNTYTNWQARYTLRSAVQLARNLKSKAPQKWAGLAKKIKLGDKELRDWEKTAAGMFINYDHERRLYIEDDFFLDKEPCDLQTLKPGKKIITELGVSWDTLLRLQIVKQADILLLMTLFPDDFTRQEKLAAWHYYEPKTCHDSSLSTNTHAIMAAQLDMPERAMHYWDQTARLDLDDTMDNSFLGVHSACVGGTWQIVVLGFAGMRLRENGFDFTPRLPKRWERVNFKLRHRGRVAEITISRNSLSVALAAGALKPLEITVAGQTLLVQTGQQVTVGY